VFDLSLTGFASLRLYIEELLGREVDLGEWSTLREGIKDDVRKDAIRVFQCCSFRQLG
jgi:predicted nucleotidyltransferase